MAARRDWIELLSPAEVTEVEAAARSLSQRKADTASLSASDFPLPTRAPRLAQFCAEVLHGGGFALLRGLGLRSGDPNVRIYQTAERQTFHTDSCDIVALLCLQMAGAGGDSALVSSSALWNQLRERRPDLARLLLEPIATDRRGEVLVGELPFFTIPVFNGLGGYLAAICQRQYIDSAQRFAQAPRLTPLHVEALDLLDPLSNDPALHFLMTLQRDDIPLVHNHTLLHDRTAFTDGPEPERRRHLLRLWLAPADARPLPSVFAQRFGSVAPGARGGVRPAEGRQVVPLSG